MTVNNTDLNVYVSKIKMIRPEKNPKSCDFDLNLNWSIDYVKTGQKTLEYICTLSAVGEISLNFAIHGTIECEDKNIDLDAKFDELSDLILDKSINTMNNLLNETKDIKIPINAASNAQITDISQITLKGWC